MMAEEKILKKMVYDEVLCNLATVRAENEVMGASGREKKAIQKCCPCTRTVILRALQMIGFLELGTS